MFYQVLLMSFLLISSFAFAAIQPMDESMRIDMASSIVEGEVLGLEAVLKLGHGDNTEFQNWYYTAQVKLTRSLKGNHQIGEIIQVTFWKVHKLPRGWTGNQGQNGMMSLGDNVKLYLKGDNALLGPNGWDLINMREDL